MTTKIKLTLLVGLLTVIQTNLTFSQTKKEAKAKSKLEQRDLYAPTDFEEAKEFYNKGHSSFEKGNFRKAIKCYKEAISIDQNFIDAYDNLGLTFRQLGKLDSAEYYCQKSIEKYQNGIVARINLGQVYSIKRQYDKALEIYREITKIDSTEPEGYFGAAKIYMAQQKFDLAIKNAKNACIIYALTEHHYSGDALSLIGASYYSKGDVQNAKIFFEEALNFGFNVPQNLMTELGIKKKKDRVIEYKTHYDNGNLKKVEYYDGFTPVGKLTEYYENGEVLKKYHYENGKPNGSCKYYFDNGQLWTERIIKDGNNWTVISNFDKNGNPLDPGTLKNGNGTMKLYNEQGELTEIITYKDGIEINSKKTK